MRAYTMLQLAGILVLSAAASVAVPNTLDAQARASAVTPRIAFVDVNLLLAAAPGREQAESGLASEVRLGETRVRLAADSLARTVQEFTRVEGEISPAQREAARLNLRARELQLEDMMQRVTATLDDRRAALQAPLVECVRTAIASVQKRDGWHAIVEIGTLGEFALVMPEADITSRVMDVLQEGAVPACSPR